MQLHLVVQVTSPPSAGAPLQQAEGLLRTHMAGPRRWGAAWCVSLHLLPLLPPMLVRTLSQWQAARSFTY